MCGQVEFGDECRSKMKESDKETINEIEPVVRDKLKEVHSCLSKAERRTWIVPVIVLMLLVSPGPAIRQYISSLEPHLHYLSAGVLVVALISILLMLRRFLRDNNRRPSSLLAKLESTSERELQSARSLEPDRHSQPSVMIQ